MNSAPLAPDKVKADELYNQGYYEQAIEAYATLLSKGSDATLSKDANMMPTDPTAVTP